MLDIGSVLENSIRINELLPREESAKASYVLVGTARGVNNSLYIVRSVVNQYANEITSVDVLYAVNAKKNQLAYARKSQIILLFQLIPQLVYLLFLILSINIFLTPFLKMS